ncbi:MAG: PQQ-binding-like beta-propeller repeat protein [Planctomycetota bacterium]
MSDQPASIPPAPWPKYTIVWTVFVVVVIALLHWQLGFLNEQFGMDPAIPWLATLALTFLTLMIWAVWATFFRKSLLLGMVFMSIPAIFLTLFYPDFGGNANFTTWRPRFWEWRSTDFAEAEGTAGVPEVVKTTPYDFPQFLGAERDVRVQNVELAEDWANGPEVLWKVDIGNGWSGFSVVGGMAVTQEQRGGEECVSCYDVTTGDLIWIYRVNRRHEDAMAMGKAGPRATPTIHDNRVYATSATGVLDCLNLSDGSLVWSKDVPQLVGIQRNDSTNSLGLTYSVENSALLWGRSCSPLIVDEKVIVTAGGPKTIEGDDNPTATLIAFDRKTGDEIWRGGQRQIAYGSPNLVTINGTKMITLIAQDHSVGHDPDSGVELWAHKRPGTSDQDANCSQVTTVGGNRLLLTKGYGLGGEIIAIEQDDEGSWTARSMTKDPRILRTKLTNPVVIDGHAYSLTDGFLECVQLDEDKFKRKWRQRARFGDGQILAVGDKLLIHSEDGELFLVEVNPEKYVQLGKLKTVDGFCWNTIGFFGDLVLVRSDLEALCYRLPTEGEPIPLESLAPQIESKDVTATNE